jgi:hypothetical protein
LQTLTARIRNEYPREFEKAGFPDGMRILATPLQRRITGDLRPALMVLSGAVPLVLFIASAHMANLPLARAARARSAGSKKHLAHREIPWASLSFS